MPRPPMFLLVASALAVPALAQPVPTHVESAGALSGRSPQRMVRPVARTESCGVAFHVPAGKPHSYGRHELGRPCSPARLAEADAPAPDQAGGEASH